MIPVKSWSGWRIELKLTDYIHPACIRIGLKGKFKEALIHELVGLIGASGYIHNLSNFELNIQKREQMETTGLGRGVAIPHGMTNDVNRMSIAVGISPDGADFDSLDGEPVHIFFMIASPDTPQDRKTYLLLLGRLAKALRNEQFRQRLRGAASADKILQILDEV